MATSPLPVGEVRIIARKPSSEHGNARPRKVAGRLAAWAALGAWLAGIGLPYASGDARGGTPPSRVVSMNLCTDQLAMLIAAPGQLHSVSHLASREDSSVLAREAAAYAVNHGQAEEIFLMKPDLVLAGSFSTGATVALLRRLGVRVETFAPEESFADISANITRMGALLERKAQADTLIAALDERLARYAAKPGAGPRPLAALAYANSYTSGGGTLANEAVERAGLDNLGARLGYRGTVRLPLEVLVMNAPEVIIGGERQADDPARAYDALRHPALRVIAGGRVPVTVPDKYWICGAPFTAEAVRILAEAAAAGKGGPR